MQSCEIGDVSGCEEVFGGAGLGILLNSWKETTDDFYSLDVECPPEAHVLKAWSPGWSNWAVVEPLRGRA
jgi:hypothetical protein